jgi:hypothetical protein
MNVFSVFRHATANGPFLPVRKRVVTEFEDFREADYHYAGTITNTPFFTAHICFPVLTTPAVWLFFVNHLWQKGPGDHPLTTP